jgi:23S rRNA (cytidine1920-2'-O)/16S rRNA (cytidine1409-2'-O)-methyltransferase
LRLDLFLVQQKLATSRTQAQDFIANGFVYLVLDEKKQMLSKSSFLVKESDKIVVVANELQKFVSRAGLKLEGALQHLNLSVKDKVVLDVGQSTGGFTDCLLHYGAKQVVGVDVGHSQLHEKIAKDPRVECFENLNVKELSVNTAFLRSVPANGFDLLVVDVSFISLTKVIPSLFNLLSEGAEYLILVKPQFECGRENLDSNGIVKGEKIYSDIEEEIKKTAQQYFKNVTAYFESSILGKDGNREFFIYGRKTT